MQTTYRFGRRRLLTLAGRTCYALYLAWLVVDAENTVEHLITAHSEREPTNSYGYETVELWRENTRRNLVGRHEALLDAVRSTVLPVAAPSNFRALSPKASRSAE